MTLGTGEFALFIPPECLTFFLSFLRLCLFNYFSLMDLFVVDYPGRVKRFEVQYILLSLLYNSRLVVRTYVSTNEPLDSVSNLFLSAAWLEREVWDLFGIFFLDHEDLRRILTDHGFEGHALRKDFPLSGFIEVRYSEVLKRLIVEPLELTQTYRLFDFSNPWI
jgi:NADH:ubiquinone oxidoreductase subunit C